MDLDYSIYCIIAPMIFLMLAKHSEGVCCSTHFELNPEKYMAAQLGAILNGMSVVPATAQAAACPLTLD